MRLESKHYFFGLRSLEPDKLSRMCLLTDIIEIGVYCCNIFTAY